MKANELREKDYEELTIEKERLIKDLMIARMQHATEQLEKTHRLRLIRKEIARIKTIIREKEKEKGMVKGSIESRYTRKGDTNRVEKKKMLEKRRSGISDPSRLERRKKRMTKNRD